MNSTRSNRELQQLTLLLYFVAGQKRSLLIWYG